MVQKNQIVLKENIKSRIFTFRGKQVMTDRDLADFYSVKTGALNQAVKRNIDRFPEEFRFQLNKEEFEDWKSQIVMSNEDKMGLRRPPYVFTEQGIAMLSAILKSEIAINISVQIMNAFVEMRKFLNENAEIFKRLNKMELKQVENDKNFNLIFKELELNEKIPNKKIFFDGQIFDAYQFISKIIKKATKSIIIIDNFIDESVLSILTKREKGVKAIIYTSKINKTLRLDIKKHNEQYENVTVKEFKKSHDRFLIIDSKDVYLIGASLKDLGKKWFGVSKMDIEALEILKRLNT